MPAPANGVSPKFVSARGEILPLTGLRIVAALWVVVFHLRGNIASEYPGVAKVLWPILHNGDLGVDLFFGLSGFVLTLNYVDKMGHKIDRARTRMFFWARLSRVWPVYFVTLNIAALWHGGLLALGSEDPVAPDEFTVISYLRQLFMVVLWTSPDADRLTWNGPAWSVSAEWLVYCLFPFIVLLLARVGRVTRNRQLMVLAMVAVFPVVIFTAAGGGLYGIDYTWMMRLLGAFVAGSLMCLVLRRIPRTRRTDRAGTVWSYVLLVALVAVLYGAHAVDRPNAAVVVVFLFPPLLLALALASGGPSRLLSYKPVVTGGHYSYSVYLVHMLIIEVVWKAQAVWPGVLGGGQLAFHVLVPLLPVVVCVAGYLMWRFVEEPARKKMRRMVDTPLAPVTVSPPPVEPVGDRVPEKV